MSDPLLAGFSSSVARSPARPVVLGPSGSPLSAGTLDALADAVRSRIEGELVRPGRLVGVVSPGGAAFLASILAVRRAGAAVLLLEPSGPAMTHRKTASALGAAAVLECPTSKPQGPEAFHLERVGADPGAAPLPAGTDFVKTTSGSTGQPRGIAVSTEALLADEAALAVSMGIAPGDRMVAAIPLPHSYGFSSVALPALLRDAVMVEPDGEGPLSPIAAAAECEATVFPTVPAYLGALLRMSQPPRWPRSVRLVVSAGAPLAPKIASRFREFSGRPVQVLYGASECGGICFDREGGAAERGTVGTPVEGVQVSLEPLGSETTEGLVVVRSDAAGSSYLPEPDVDRLSPGRFRGSDVACWQGGELKLLRRIDAIVNIKGRKVDPAEVEQALAALPGVEEVVALGVRDPRTGRETLRVVIACRPGGLTAEDVVRFCRSRLPDHKVPRSIRLVPHIPRTDRGKIDRTALAEGS